MRLWSIRAWKRDAVRDWIYAAECSFVSNAETIEEAFEQAHKAGFACLYKNPQGKIIAAADMNVRMSSIKYTGELT